MGGVGKKSPLPMNNKSIGVYWRSFFFSKNRRISGRIEGQITRILKDIKGSFMETFRLINKPVRKEISR